MSKSFSVTQYKGVLINGSFSLGVVILEDCCVESSK